MAKGSEVFELRGGRAGYEGGRCVGGSDLRLGLREGRGDRSQVIAMQEPYVGRRRFQKSVRSQDQAGQATVTPDETAPHQRRQRRQ